MTAPMAWMVMYYGCQTCKKIEPVYLEAGLEGGPEKKHRGNNYVPVPSTIHCDECFAKLDKNTRPRFLYGAMHHLSSKDNRFLNPPEPVPAGARYFRVPTRQEKDDMRKHACGIPMRAPQMWPTS